MGMRRATGKLAKKLSKLAQVPTTKCFYFEEALAKSSLGMKTPIPRRAQLPKT